MSRKRVFFIVDDDADDQDLFIEAVHEIDESITCFSASDCEEALELLKGGTIGFPDIIFLDLNLPRINGKQCLAALKEDASLQRIPVIIYSTSSEKKDIDEVTRLGAVHFLTKPNRFVELCNALSYVIRKEWPVVIT